MVDTNRNVRLRADLKGGVYHNAWCPTLKKYPPRGIGERRGKA